MGEVVNGFGQKLPWGYDPQMSAAVAKAEDAVKTTGPRKLLEWAIVQYMDEHYPSYGVKRWSPPPNLRLELHPSTHHLIRQDPDFEYPGSEISEKLQIPMKINRDLGEGEWRLVVVTEDVKTEGRLS